MKKTFLLACALMAGLAVSAATMGTGASCYNPIELGKDYNAAVTSNTYPKSIWYSAWTFDLPLKVYFFPQNESDPAPEISMDFGCTPGVYSDPLICMLFCQGSGSVDIGMPHKPTLNTETKDGRFCYSLSMGKFYRDLLLKVGIDYNVQVLVNVIYHAPGEISMAPDDFSNCMDGYKFMHLGDTVQVKSLDKDRHVIVPYVQWQEDSIRYVWNGTAPVEVAIGNTCDIDPTDGTDIHRVDYFVLQPQDTLKMTSSDVKYYIQSDDVSSEAGMFYAKFFTTGTGTMKIEKVPQAPPQGGATLLRYDRATPVPANGFDALYAIPFTWKTATLFSTPTDHIFRMYIGTTYDFTKETAIASYQFSKDNSGHWLGLQASDMQSLWAKTTAQYLYVRFECTAKTTITPSEWIISPCIGASKEIKRPSTTVTVAKGSYGPAYYRFYYDEWKGGDMTFDWQSVFSTCPTFIGDTCKFNLNASAAHVLSNKNINATSTWTIPAIEVAEWATNVDADGYLYVRFNPGSQGVMVISTTAPEEVDPAPVVYPAATVSVTCDGEKTSSEQPYIVRVSVPQTLNLYSGPAGNIASRTPIRTWSQTPGETHSLTLQTGIYTLMGTNEAIQIEVQ
ncbi:MAG: hypothetical protein IJV28_01820 [Paludibacteraceae bacterium]|nr:hypothetical protein [Paludibacteraceae bacterium]